MPAKTIKQRLDEYDRMAGVTTYVAGGLAGVALFGAGDLGANLLDAAPSWISAAFITTGLVAGGCLGRAYSGMRWAHHQLQSFVENSVDVSADDPPPDCLPPPESAATFYKVALILLLTTAGWLITGVWWAAAA